MKKGLFILSILLIFVGCNEKISKIEVLPNYDEIYLTESKVSDIALPVDTNFSDEMMKSFQQTLQKVIQDENIKENSFHINYTLYINEKGKVDKISEGGNKKFTELILPVIEKWNFSPAKLDGMPVKSRKKIQANFILKDGKLVEEKVDLENTYFVAVEEMPSPIGGLRGIQKRIKYTQAAINSGIEGKIYVLAFINKNGIVTNAKIIKGIDKGLDESALQAVKATKFNPGKQRGKPVNVQVSIPVIFSLKN